jgi:predicted MPP superfamily phosphohydrolase
MKLSILHISDLHRDPKNPIRNEPLLDSLEVDLQRYTSSETPTICPPNIILVSGDVIHGVKEDSLQAEQELADQYDEALRFLNQLTINFVNGDRRKVIIVPGNHDVSAFHFVQCLKEVKVIDDRKKALVSELFSPNSRLRWCWNSFQLFEIADRTIYDKRLEAFCEFYARFYENRRSYDIDPANQFDVFDYPEFDVAFAAFNSCHNNDVFNKQASIHPVCVGQAASKLRHPAYQDRLRIAVWHHNTEGIPMQFDYIDPDILQNLIDRGFSLGFHGHQHKPQFIDCRFRYGGDRRITVIAAGTLCGGAAPRFARAYNVIELDLGQLTGRLHLRQMQNDNLALPIWGQGSILPDMTSFTEFAIEPPPEPFVRTSTDTPTLMQAQTLYDENQYEEAAKLFRKLSESDDLARRLLLDCYGKTGDSSSIIADFDPPQSNTEAIYLMDALWTEGKKKRLRELLDSEIVADSTDLSIIELREKYEAKLAE